MDTTYWAILLGSAGAGFGVAAGLAHLAAAARTTTVSLAVPAVVLALVAGNLGSATQADAAAGPADLVVQVRTRMYEFQIGYQGQTPAKGDLVLPAGKTSRIDLEALDVVHAFWIPDLSVRATIVPGAPTSVLIRPTAPGEYRLLCAEFCGPDHAAMRGTVRVLAPENFDRWMAQRSKR